MTRGGRGRWYISAVIRWGGRGGRRSMPGLLGGVSGGMSGIIDDGDQQKGLTHG